MTASSQTPSLRSNERRSTHHVHRGPESLPCYCAASSDHSIGQEQTHPPLPAPMPNTVDDAMTGALSAAEPHLSAIAANSGLEGVWCNAFRRGWSEASKSTTASSNSWHAACVNVLWTSGETYKLFDRIKELADAIERGEVYPSPYPDPPQSPPRRGRLFDAVKMVNAEKHTINEVRAHLGFPPVPHGNRIALVSAIEDVLAPAATEGSADV